MKAVRLHRYEERPIVEEVVEPEAKGPYDVVVRDGGAGLCRTDLHIVEGQWAERATSRCRTRWVTRTPAAWMLSARRWSTFSPGGCSDPAPAGDLRFLPGRRRRSLRASAFPGIKPTGA